LLLGFGEKNPGMIRVLLGDALWLEDERLQERILQIFERIESSLKQSLRIAQTQGRLTQSADGQEVSARAAMMMSYVVGRWHRYARSGFKKSPTELNDLPMRVLFSA
jgi:TetR/AcrR family transcriptional regulator